MFLDEMGIQVGLMREMARSLQGTRAYDFDCLYRGKRVNLIGAMSLRGLLSVNPLAQSLTGELFKEFLRDELIPKLWTGAVLVMDNLRAHQVPGVQEMLADAGVNVVYLPPYSPEFNPIEHFWWELKAFVRRFRPKDQDSIETLVEIGVLLNSSDYRKNYFTHCCYCTN